MIKRLKTFVYLGLWLVLNLLSLPVVGVYMLARYMVLGARDSFHGRRRSTRPPESLP